MIFFQDMGCIGCEFSGYDKRQRRVMGLVEYGALATLVAADPKLLWEVPASWNLEQAATVPLFYATVRNMALVGLSAELNS